MEQKQKSENYTNLGGINTKISPYQTGPQEFLDLSNVDFTRPGSLTKSPGTTLFVSATLQGRVGGLFEFSRLNGFSQTIVSANTNIYHINGNVFTAFNTGLLNNGIFSFVTFVDRLFSANGTDFFKYDGANVSRYSLPYGDTTAFGVTAVVGGGMSGNFYLSYGYFNDRGYFGPPGPLNGSTIALNGVTFGSIRLFGMTTPSGYGISGIALYLSFPGLVAQFQATLIPIQSTFLIDNGVVLSTTPAPDYIHFTLVPRYLEIYNNQLLMGGFSSQLSTIWFSDVGEPEGVKPEFNFQVRTNDADKVFGFRSYNGSAVIFKEKSFHKLSGDNPDNFLLSEVSDQYGCLSHRAIVIYQDFLWFLDRKGICQYNGANVEVVSDKIEPLLNSMNIDAAKENAVAIHNRFRNEIWFSIPINGATLNNVTLVYDYVAKGWTKFEGFMPSSLSMVRATFQKPRAFFGSYSGSIFNFDESIRNYAGQAMTCVIQPRFLGEQGKSVQSVFRRLFMDTDQVNAGVSSIQVNFLQDYGSSIVLTRYMGQAQFQSRIDFGISAKSLSFQAVHANASLPLVVNGWTVESRMQRMV